MAEPLRLRVAAVERYERPVRLRLPFRFGVVTLTEAPQAFVRARVRLADGREAWGAAAELLAPKWFDKDLALSNEDNFAQLREALALAAAAYAGDAALRTPFGLFAAHYRALLAAGAARGLNPLVVSFGPALLDRAVLDAAGRLAGVSFYDAVRANLAGIDASLTPELARFDLAKFLRSLAPSATLAVRHTVGLIDPLTAADAVRRVDDGLPETLEEVVAAYGHRYFKLKVAGDVDADVERLARIAAVIDARPGVYQATLDGNEQYHDVEGIAALWQRILATPRLARLAESTLFIEQPIARAHALERDVRALARLKPVIIDESDGDLDAFPRARALGYAGVSSKACKGFYKSLLNAARCALWTAEGRGACFMSGEDLTCQAGLSVQQDLAIVSLLGLGHVERNGHHYVNGMAGLPRAEQQRFLAAHPDLYEDRAGAVRLRIADGSVRVGSLAGPGFASGAEPEWSAMTRLA
ncbi:MAG: mandelate racemase [Burkholderiales bacterium]|nr:mandelate racemase [Burkholderiales bacterium]